MNWLLDLTQQYAAFLKANPVVAGFVSVWLLGTVTWFLRNAPLGLWRTIAKQTTTTLYINNSAVGTNLESFNNFLRWFESTRWAQLSRTLALQGGYTEYGPKGEGGTIVGIGDGRHFGMYKGRPFWITRKRLESNASSYQINYEIRITMFGRSRQSILDLIEEFRYRPRAQETGIYVWSGKEWRRVGHVRNRPLDTVIIDPVVKAALLARIDKWLGEAQWYYDRGWAWKLTVMLYGIPGSGKTSLIKALAGHYKRDLCLLHLASMSDTQLRDALMTAPDDSLIAMEDFDDVDSIHARSGLQAHSIYAGVTVDASPAGGSKALEGESLAPALSEGPSDTPQPNIDPTTGSIFSGVTLSGILQSLDGLFSLDGKLLFLTTNRPEVLDAALVRKGRINASYNIGALQSPQVHEYLRLMYGDAAQDYAHLTFAPIPGCDLEDAYKVSESLEGLIETLTLLPESAPLPQLEAVAQPDVPAANAAEPWVATIKTGDGRELTFIEGRGPITKL